jgi:hypothetical protein
MTISRFSIHDKVAAFRAATPYLARMDKTAGLSDRDLSDLLEKLFGVAGSCRTAEGLYVAYQGSGLKIWVKETDYPYFPGRPFLQGAKTLQWAREVYDIACPNGIEARLPLF